MNLEGKVAIVTGGTRGIGAGIARRLAAEGAKLVLSYRSRADDAEALIGQLGDNALALRADIADAGSGPLLVNAAVERFGGLDILINNAGRPDFAPLASVAAETLHEVFALNTIGLLMMSQAAAQHMRDGGSIVSISSMAARSRSGGLSVYAGSKAAVEAFTRCWATELAPRRITVNTVVPGVVDTDLLRQTTPEERISAYVAPLGRLGAPEDIAAAVAFLCSEDGRWITGQDIVASGGA
ncbi:3-oxoacyl-[acyl-carrier protein] reductase [Novosphingobium hassiacum]|uniref:3-oxoacyl-[acyl-carrier protein] reductase n=1 Tax=Novosphingobium hassiacum TaxID=173676 RepID=A0A7W6EW74_9SPHN|nr:glucose 1-dehydrogenase [Novosphingobium hassiacum]MBB3860941.1 3-oxoacyl-[acyl-carrier protein] reductase [Novosphingobium hassiacum]